MLKRLLLVAACLLLCACGTTVSGTPVAVPSKPAAPTPTVTKVPRSDLDAELIELRKVDACALLDPKAATKVTGDLPSSLVPSDGFNECRLMLENGHDETWEFRVIVGALWIQDGAPKTTIAGIRFARVRAADEFCTYTMRFKQHSAITLFVTRPYDDKKADPCVIGQKYLAAAAGLWTHLPLYSEVHTTPHLPLADVDPCDAADVEKGLEWIANPISPSKCDINMGADNAIVKLGLDLDPRKIDKSSSAKAVTVAGHQGRALEGEYGDGCDLTVLFADSPEISEPVSYSYSAPVYQVITVSAGDRSHAEAVVEEILAVAAKQPRAPAPAPGPNVIPLGDFAGR